MPRPKKDIKTVRVTLSASVLPEIDSQVKVLAITNDRSNSWIVEKLILRGLAAYKRDGLLDEPPSLIPVAFENLPDIDGSDAPTRNEELPEPIGIILPM